MKTCPSKRSVGGVMNEKPEAFVSGFSFDKISAYAVRKGLMLLRDSVVFS
jgi:hypothetical protein